MLEGEFNHQDTLIRSEWVLKGLKERGIDGVEEAQKLVEEGKLLGTVLCGTQLHARALLESIEAFGIKETGVEGLELEDERYYMIPLDTIERKNGWNKEE